MRKLSLFFVTILGCMPLFGGTEPGGEPAKTITAAPAPNEAAKARELSEGLIYSVDRVPESTFDSARAVEVITISELWRKSGMSLVDVLQHEAGITAINYDAPGGVPLVRGLHGKQVMVMIDGVKVNDAMWRSGSKDYLGIVDLSQVERVEIVRGVVSVLGTESLGGIINVITKKGPPDSEAFGGTIGARYATSEHAFRTPVEIYGQSDKLRWIAGANYLDSANMHAGGDVGEQANTGYNTNAFHASMQYLMSTEKTLSTTFRSADEKDFSRAWSIESGTSKIFDDGPAKFRMGTVSYEDLTDRSFANSLRSTLYFNRQVDARTEVRNSTANISNEQNETDNMLGLNVELSRFFGRSHQVLYGVDASSETVHSKATDVTLSTGLRTAVRGRYTDGAKYKTLGVYLQDRFNVGRWLTATAGVRYGKFQSSGAEQSSVGVVSVDASNGDITSALNLVFHATPHLNLIANSMRGFRAPNIDELSRLSLKGNGGLDVPNPAAGPEHVNSYELGAKYENGHMGGSFFYYRNNLTDLLVRQPGTYRGLPYLDQNGNGKQDAKEPGVFQLQNTGTAKITGYEGDFHFAPASGMTLSGNITKTVGTDTTVDQPLDRVPPIFGNLTYTIFGTGARALWGQALFDFAGSQHRLSPLDVTDYRIGPNGTYGYRVFSVRAGANVAERIRLMVGVDNLTDAAYKLHDSFVYRPGRQLVIGTEYRF